MDLLLVAQDPRLADAWRRAFADLEGVSIEEGSILDHPADAVVSPANSFGFMDGGIDAVYLDAFGAGVQTRLRRLIFEKHHGELLVGNAEIVETDDARHPYLIAAPTMRVPMALPPETVNPYLATRAVMILLRHGFFAGGAKATEPVARHVRRVAFPGMGTGVGRVPHEICARQMRAAIAEYRLGPARLPSSWAEASETHQLLYTDKPKRLQY
jgi:O-acetyl-ADP-ribose deacetylase (regulator of RNase III)